MPDSKHDDRPPVVVAMQWVTQITTIGLEMAIPAGLGYWADTRWGTEPWLVSVGAIVGFAVGMRHLLWITGNRTRPNVPGKPDRDH